MINNLYLNLVICSFKNKLKDSITISLIFGKLVDKYKGDKKT